MRHERQAMSGSGRPKKKVKHTLPATINTLTGGKTN